MKEEALLFGKTGSLVGIVTDPIRGGSHNKLPAFIFMNTGMVHRVGANRLSVKMARDLAAMGFLSFRYDSSGMGDSSASNDDAPLMERWIGETQEAMSCISAERGIDRFVLVGHCWGAVISLKTACWDPRVMGAALIGLPAEKPLARYYWRLVKNNPKTWLRIITGVAKWTWFVERMTFRVRNLFTREKRGMFGSGNFAADLHLLTKRGTSLVFIYSEWDSGLDYFDVFLRNQIEDSSVNGKSRVEVVPGMNHSFDLIWGQQCVIKIIHNWALKIAQEELGVESVGSYGDG